MRRRRRGSRWEDFVLGRKMLGFQLMLLQKSSRQ